jgi:hypothetical protein
VTAPARRCGTRVSLPSSYPDGMLPSLRDQRGKPAAPLRLLAVLVVIGMLVLAAPVLVPLLRWAAGLVF